MAGFAACGGRSGDGLEPRHVSSNANGEAGSAGASASPIGGSPHSAGHAGSTGADHGGTAGATNVAGAGGERALPEGRTFYVSPTGDDENPGTDTRPLRTIAAAARFATAGDNILLQDGVFDEFSMLATADGIIIPDGVSVRAVNVGKATLSSDKPHPGLSLESQAEITGLRFQNLVPAVLAAGGSVTLKDLSFDMPSGESCGKSGQSALVELQGNVDARWELGSDKVIGNRISCLLRLREFAGLQLQAGTLEGAVESPFADSALLANTDNARLTVSGVHFKNSALTPVLTSHASKLTLRGSSSFIGKGGTQRALLHVAHEAKLGVFDHVQFDGAGSADCVLFSGRHDHSQSDSLIADTEFKACNYAIRTTDRVNYLTLRRLAIADSRRSGIAFDAGGILRIEESRISGSAESGLVLDQVEYLNVLQSAFTGNKGEGIYVRGERSSVQLNQCVLSGNAGPNLRIEPRAPLASISALGSTWNASQQGADADGKYPLLSPPQREVAGPVSGPNFVIAGAHAAVTKLILAASSR